MSSPPRIGSDTVHTGLNTQSDAEPLVGRPAPEEVTEIDFDADTYQPLPVHKPAEKDPFYASPQFKGWFDELADLVEA